MNLNLSVKDSYGSYERYGRSKDVISTHLQLICWCENKLITTQIIGVIEVSYVVIVVLKPKMILLILFNLSTKIERPVTSTDLTVVKSKSRIVFVEEFFTVLAVLTLFVEAADLLVLTIILFGSSRPDTWERILVVGFISCFDLLFTTEELNPLSFIIIGPCHITSARFFQAQPVPVALSSFCALYHMCSVQM